MEKERRQRIRKRPSEEAESRYKKKLWAKQKEILEAVFKYPKVAVRACHGPGKTFTGARCVLCFLDAYWPSKVVTTAPTNTQVEKLLWGEINRAYRDAGDYPGRCLNRELKISAEHYGIGFSTDEPVNFQGFHERNILVVVDEAAGVKREVFDELETLMTSENAKMLQIGNPDESVGNFYEAFQDPNYFKIVIDAFSTPNFSYFGITEEDIIEDKWTEKITGDLPYPELVTPAWVADKYIRWGPESPMYISKVKANFPDESIEGLIALSWVEKAQGLTKFVAGVNQFGLDVARFGDDRSVLTYRSGNEVVKSWVFRKLDTVQLAEWAQGIIKNVNSEAIIAVDAVGIGAGTFDILNHKGFKVFEYQGAASPHEEESSRDFINERAEFYWNLRTLFQEEEIGGVIDEETKQELVATKYKYRNGKIKIAEKDEIKKELGRSPDKADALMLAFAPISVEMLEEQYDWEIEYEDQFAREGKY